MGLLDEIRDSALDDRTSLAQVLRRCLLLGHRLKYDPLKAWTTQELNGYAATDLVPPYRVLTGQLLDNFVIPGYRLASHHVDLAMFPTDVVENITTVHLMQDVATLQRWEAQDRIRLSPGYNNLEAYITRNIGANQHCTSAWLAVSPAEITGVLSQIRNRTVEFVLNIEDEIGEAALSEVAAQPRACYELCDRVQSTGAEASQAKASYLLVLLVRVGGSGRQLRPVACLRGAQGAGSLAMPRAGPQSP